MTPVDDQGNVFPRWLDPHYEENVVEFMSEDELLAEFHAAGIFTPEEIATMERGKVLRQRAHDFERYLSDSLRDLMQTVRADQLRNQGGIGNLGALLGGGLFGGLLGR